MKIIESNPKGFAFIIFIIVVVLYLLFQARFLILGPSISIYTPKNGEIVASSTIVVSGQARNIAYISLDDRPIFIDENGVFNEKLIAYPGQSILVMRARDRFGRTTEKTLRIIYNN